MALIRGNNRANRLTGTNGNDILKGLAGNDVLSGLGRHDFLDGGTGNDTMRGGIGNDTYVVDSSRDVVIEGGGRGIDRVLSSIGTILAANIENLTLRGRDKIGGTGNNLDNVIIGNRADNSLNGLDGNDRLFGGAGNDRLFGGAGNDYLNGGPGADVMVGLGGNDTYIVNDRHDFATELGLGAGGIDIVYSSAPDVLLFFEIENLVLTGTTNIDGSGNYLANLIVGNSGSNLLNGGAGDDTLQGNDGNDTLEGKHGVDHMFGGAGSDVLDGGIQADVLDGGIGADIYRYTNSNESPASANLLRADVIVFSQADGDRIDLSAIDASSSIGENAFAFIGTGAFTGVRGQLRYELVVGLRTKVEADVTGDRVAEFQLVLQTPITLAASDFIL